jgi:hypothetical protein
MISKVVLSIILFFYVPLPISASVVEIGNNVDTIERPPSIYKVFKLNKTMPIDANWNKAEWRKIKSIKINNYMGKLPAFKPQVEAKMMYDYENVYVIFRVKDRFVHSLVQEYNGNVSGDAAVEFFFAPDTHFPLRYFNLEVNAGGTPLMFYIMAPPPYPKAKYIKLDSVDIKQIEIAHSLPKIIDPEITNRVTWTLEYRIPLSMLEKFSNVTRPELGVVWKANFYKTASLSSNPHWITWVVVDSPKPNFHLPKFFGTLKFQ